MANFRPEVNVSISVLICLSTFESFSECSANMLNIFDYLCTVGFGVCETAVL